MCIRDRITIANLLNPRRWLFARVEQELLSASRPPVVLALSEYVKRGIRKHYRLPEDRLRVLFNAVDLSRFEPPARAVGTQSSHAFVTALIVAQDFERKGLASVLRAMALIRDDRLRLVVVGKPNPARFRRLALRLGVESQVTFAGPVTDVTPYYHSADFFVLPTRHDPCSLVVLEALSTGLPVISTVMNGACEIMTDGEHGFVLDDADNVAQLAGAMTKLMSDAERAAMRQACLALRDKLSYQTHIQSLIEIYGSILRARSGAHGVI
jgi:UDP-glucose:(heptosyl)LPS alpha-1,3-glucosyltransferase